MADHETDGRPREHAPGWLFRLNTTLGARLNTPAWMGAPAAEGTAPAIEAEAAPESVQPPSSRPR